MRTSPRPENPIEFALMLGAAGLLAGCGISLGSGSIDDPLPSGVIVAQGPLSGQNSHTVSGTVSVWQQSGTSTCTFVLRLQSLSAPTGMTLNVVPLVNGASVSPTFYTLRGSTGNQNYTFTGAACGSTWAQLSIVDSTDGNSSTNLVGLATLTHP